MRTSRTNLNIIVLLFPKIYNFETLWRNGITVLQCTMMLMTMIGASNVDVNPNKHQTSPATRQQVKQKAVLLHLYLCHRGSQAFGRTHCTQRPPAQPIGNRTTMAHGGSGYGGDIVNLNVGGTKWVVCYRRPAIAFDINTLTIWLHVHFLNTATTMTRSITNIYI